jgi:hypothetical protein
VTLEIFRLIDCLTGAAAAGFLLWRLLGRWQIMDWIGRIVVTLLAMSVLVFGLGAARAAALDSPFNEFAVAGFLIQIAAVLTCIFWRRLLDPDRSVRRL